MNDDDDDQNDDNEEEDDDDDDEDDDDDDDDGAGKMHASALSSGAWDTLVFRVALNRRLQCLAAVAQRFCDFLFSSLSSS